MKVEGWFLPLLAGLAVKADPFLAQSYQRNTGVGLQKLLGDGLFIKKGGCVCEIEKNGKRVFLEPVNGKELTKLGDGLYLKKNIIKCTMEKDCCQDQTVH